MKWKCFHEIMTGMGNPFLTTDNKLITLYTRGACISCVLFPNLWSWPNPPRNITTPPSDVHHHEDTTIRHTYKRNSSLMIYNRLDPWKGKATLGFWNNIVCSSHNSFISLKSRWTELFEDPLEPPVYLYQIEMHSELGSYWNYYVYMHTYAKRSRQYINRSKAAVHVVDMAAIHMVPPTRASTFLITGTLVHYVFLLKLRWRPFIEMAALLFSETIVNRTCKCIE